MIRIGALGVGRFGRFALEQFARVEGTALVAIGGTDDEGTAAARERFGVPDVGEAEDLIGRGDVDLVYVATPPFLHHPQAMRALAAGKHVICEKPLALTLEQADEMIGLARDRRLLLVANLMQRYNPLYRMVEDLVRSRLLGDVLHGSFENHASREGLSPDHWFWDEARSGGILVEHAVHFFDMFEGWLGPGELRSAERVYRPGGFEEQASCTVEHPGGVLVHQYHGFTQAATMERQELRLSFGTGRVTVRGWVPTRARVEAMLDEPDVHRLHGLFPGGQVSSAESEEPEWPSASPQERPGPRVELRWEAEVGKYELYGRMLRSFLADQIRWIVDPGHRRTVTEENGRASLDMALRANRIAIGVERPGAG